MRLLPARRRRAAAARTAPRRSRLRPRDLVDESLAGVLARPARAALTTLGTVLGLASLVATLGISRTAGSQIVDQFDELQATLVTVSERQTGGPPVGALPWDVERRVLQLNGVVAAGAVATVSDAGGVRTVPFVDPTAIETRAVPVIAASSGFLAAVRGEVSSGRWFDDGHVRRGDRVAVIGSYVAEVLGITDVSRQPGIVVGDEVLTVIGIVDTAPRDLGLLGSVAITSTVAAERFRVGAPERVLVETELGAAGTIARQAPVALNPNSPEMLTAASPPDLAGTRDAVEEDVNGMFLLLGLISLVVGAIGIANVTLVTVMERTGEIGLRRALGARRRHIAGQVLCESAAMGGIGGIIGASAGILTVVAVAAGRDWTPLLDPWLPIAAPPVGALVGLLAGLYPALRAARMEPVDALRAGT